MPMDKKSGTCPSGTDKPPRKATSIATLRWETLPEQVRQRLPDAPTHNRLTPQGSRTYKEKRSRDCVRLRHPQTLAGSNPSGSPRGENNRPGGGSASASVGAQNPLP